MKIFLACIVLVIAVNYASASCTFHQAVSIPHKWSSKDFVYCEYKGTKYMDGSKFIDAETCKECTCSGSGMTCCGIGYYAGRITVPGCTVVPDHCAMVFLNKQKTGLCFS